MSSPGAPPSTAAAAIRSTRDQYGPPVSIMIDSSPPIAGSSASSCRPVANATAMGTHSASTARTIVPHGTGTFLGRATSASQSGTTPISQSGTPSRAPPAGRVPFTLRTRSKARDKRQRAITQNGRVPARLVRRPPSCQAGMSGRRHWPARRAFTDCA
jgi:hypothetical protein